jgi:hypothetical protein
MQNRPVALVTAMKAMNLPMVEYLRERACRNQVRHLVVNETLRLGAKVISLVSMWVSVGGVDSTDHADTHISTGGGGAKDARQRRRKLALIPRSENPDLGRPIIYEWSIPDHPSPRFCSITA